MWTLWFVPLVFLAFICAAVVSLIAAMANKKWSARKIAIATGAPFGCALIPIVLIGVVGLLGKAMQKSDQALYKEIFGEPTTISDDRMLFDDSGGSEDRSIFMRTEPTSAERARILSVPGLVTSTMTPEQFMIRGESHGFMWWMNGNGDSAARCEDAKVWEAPNFNGWGEFKVAECLRARSDLPEGSVSRYLYVIAERRP